MAVKNSYPEKPVVPYKKTSVAMKDVVAHIASLPLGLEVKRATYIFFRNESASGTRGINNNYGGIQADGGRWPAKFDCEIVGTVVLKENQTGKERRFVAFKDFRASVDFLADRVQARGLYVGGYAGKIAKIIVPNKETLARVYQKEWVKGNKDAEPTEAEKNNFLFIYKQAQALFPKPEQNGKPNL